MNNDFYIDNNRVMISLGPLSNNKYCPYDCAFCYVKSGFAKYPNLEIDEIINYLKTNREMYNIIYISGDTDSFAPPRTKKAIKILDILSKTFDVDITFTTRTVFTTKELNELERINNYMKNKNRKLIASISISRLYSANFIEPKPIPNPEKRIETLRKLKERGLYTMLAVRPFLPIIDYKEYIEIIEKCNEYVDVVLGEIWYADEDLIKVICKDIDISKISFIEKTMDFDINKKRFKCYEAKEVVEKIEEYCKNNHIKFYMRSYPAIEYIRSLN